MSHSHKRGSRWEHDNVPHSTNRGLSNATISDEAAVQAIVASLAPTSKEKKKNKSEPRTREEKGHKRPRHGDSGDYYGPKGGSGPPKPAQEDDEKVDKQKANFALSGALSQDMQTGNVYKGVLLKFREPPEARAPSKHQWRLYVFKGDEQIDVLHVYHQSAYLIARNEDIADIPLQHPSCSQQHAVLQYRRVDGKVRPYIMDLESTHGTFLNGVKIETARYYQLKNGDVLKFGASTREYVLLYDKTKKV